MLKFTQSKENPNMFKTISYRIIQKALYGFSFIIPWKFPQVIQTHESPKVLVQLLIKHKIKSILLVTDQSLRQLKMIDPFLNLLEEHHINVVIYDGVVPNPILENVEEGYALTKQFPIEWIVAIGGGSVMDCAKAIGVKMVRKTPLKKLKGILKVIKPIPPCICIPTTAGTGSETTVASVLSDPVTKEKFAISDPALFPHTAILDPTLIASLPLPILAATGVDALTHAIESHLNQNHTKQTISDANQALEIIFKHLPLAYTTQNIEHKEKMLWASFLAGRSFTRAYVGYVHGLAHQLGAYYHIPHGVANAVLLPHVLRTYGPIIEPKLNAWYQLYINTSSLLSVSEGAHALIEHIEAMNASMNIPRHFKQLKEEDFDAIVVNALNEVHPTYPVPRFLTHLDLVGILHKVKD